jgi:O-antigen/teichoic acid export membrane protein
MVEKKLGGPGSPLWVLVATAVAGVAGFVITILINRQLGPAAYLPFAIFWAALYLVVGGLSGIQQEVTRATRPIGDGVRTHAKARNFALAAGALVFIVVLVSSPVWTAAVFPGGGWWLVLPLAVGTASYVLVATLSGSLYGVSQWSAIALMVGVDGVLRLVLVVLGLFATTDVVVLAWLVVLPFPVTLAIVWPLVRRRFVGSSDLDVGYRDLTWNVLRTVLASVSTAVLVSGFPVILGLASKGVPAAVVGEFTFVLTLTRAPLIVTVMALQGFLVVRFRDHPALWLRFFAAVQGVIVAGALVLGVLGWLLGPWVFGLVSRPLVSIDGPTIVLIVVSSAFVGALTVSGAAVLARGDHFAYSAGWVAAAITTVAIIALPVDFATRVEAALLAGPLVGLAVHAVWLFLPRRSRAAAGE